MNGSGTASSRRRRVIALAGLTFALAVVGVSVVQVAHPSTEEPDHVEAGSVDAVVVHASSQQRLDAGLEVAESADAQALVISATGGDYGQSPTEMTRLCDRSQPFEVLCVPPPEPGNTLAEARAFGQVIAERGWDRVAVVTSRAHLTRATTAVRQCTDADVIPVAADPEDQPSMDEIRDEWIRAVATATVVRAC